MGPQYDNQSAAKLLDLINMVQTSLPFTLWLMGPTASGKTTLAEAYLDRLRIRNIPSIHFDGDEVRDFFGGQLGFRKQDRLRVVSTVVYLANKARDAGLNVIVSALTANPDAREYVLKNLHGPIMGYVKCSISTCTDRDPKGLYAKAKSGKITTLIGWSEEYNPPDDPDLILDTESNGVATLLDQIDDLIFGNPSYTNSVENEKPRNPTRYGDWENNGRCIDF